MSSTSIVYIRFWLYEDGVRTSYSILVGDIFRSTFDDAVIPYLKKIADQAKSNDAKYRVLCALVKSGTERSESKIVCCDSDNSPYLISFGGSDEVRRKFEKELENISGKINKKSKLMKLLKDAHKKAGVKEGARLFIAKGGKLEVYQMLNGKKKLDKISTNLHVQGYGEVKFQELLEKYNKEDFICPDKETVVSDIADAFREVFDSQFENEWIMSARFKGFMCKDNDKDNARATKVNDCRNPLSLPPGYHAFNSKPKDVNVALKKAYDLEPALFEDVGLTKLITMP